MEGMSDSLFLDPFRLPDEQPAAPDATHATSAPMASAAPAGETIAGTVVESAPASDAADVGLAVQVPLDAVAAAGAFLDDVHLWWPRDRKATDADGHLSFGGGELQEEGTDGEIHRWAVVAGAVDGVLELDWEGPPLSPGPDSVRAEGPRLFLSWAETSDGGTAVTVRGTSGGSWQEDWEHVLAAFSRFTGGGAVHGAEGSS